MGYLGVRHRRVGHEHLEQSLPPLGQAGEGLADDLSALIGEKTFVDLRSVYGNARELGIIVTEYDPLTRGQGAQALIARSRRQPGTNSLRILDTINVLEQPQPGCLDYIRSVALH
jgi:hypothetical protein